MRDRTLPRMAGSFLLAGRVGRRIHLPFSRCDMIGAVRPASTEPVDAADRDEGRGTSSPRPHPGDAASASATGAWHARSAEDALRALGSTEAGLDAGEAARRLAIEGPNALAEPERPGLARRLLRQLDNVLIYVLLVSALVTAFIGQWLDASIILAVVVINTVIGLVQEGRAERALEGVRKLLTASATAIRAGVRENVRTRDLVPGDVVALEAGDRVAADLRLVRATGLAVSEAVLTGESVPADKGAAPVAPDATLGERASMAFAGTLVVRGTGLGVVTATGPRTEIGRIGTMLATVPELTTPLTRRLAEFGRWLTVAILALAGATFLYGLLVHGFAAREMLLAAVAIAVAAIPEGLPPVMTITLAIGVERMARRRAIIRRLPAVETLGSVTAICSDKTGTFTRNEMSVQEVATAQGRFGLTGTGYAPDGALTRDGAVINAGSAPSVLAALAAAALCNDAALRRDEEEWRVVGDPMEGALLAAAGKLGLSQTSLVEEAPRRAEVPFETERRFMATLHAPSAGGALVYLKGAPEAVISRCAFVADAGGEPRPIDASEWNARAAAMTQRGERVLAVAEARLARRPDGFEADDIERLTLLGLFGLLDPPRKEAAAAVARCHAAGIKVKMITGDHPGTAAAIAHELGLARPSAVLTGVEIDAISQERLRAAVVEADVFARTSPENKLRIVSALQGRGEVVAMTGDGVNDAPALRRADVGVAMGRAGSDAAREAAEMVLLDDNFASITAAVEEGRTVYDNLKKTIYFLLPTSFAEALTLVVAVLLGWALPITAPQILWVNMVTAVTLGLALAFEPAEGDVMARPPRAPDASILSPLLVWRTGFVALILLAGTFGVFVWMEGAGADIERARAAAITTLVLFEAAHLLSVRVFNADAVRASLSRGARIAWAAILAVSLLQAVFVFTPPMQALFGVGPLTAREVGVCALVASSVFVLVEAEKALRRIVRRRGVPVASAVPGWRCR